MVEETLKQFLGEIHQVPPVFSACKVDGKRAYDLARKGEEVELKPKLLVIDELELLECDLVKMEIKIRVVCSKGTYIRALARDIGEALHSGAHLTGLVRTRVGEVKLEDCLDPLTFAEWIDRQEIEITEDNLNIVECFSTDNNTCNLNDSCKLKPIINDALSSFITEFYKYTLYDIL